VIRGATGDRRIRIVGGERIEAFVPRPLPPSPPVQLDGALQRLLESASVALGRLDGISSLLPDTGLLLYAYVRKEAVLSSMIEGTQSSISDLLLFELDGTPGAPLDDVTEVSNYVAALDHGLARLREGFPVSNRLIREIHGVLLARGRGSDKTPGEFRRSQNWIGGTRPGNATFVPPPPELVEDCMAEFERFLHDGSDLPALVKAALAHVQFETIHPFLDGNGRTGRLLITLLLTSLGVLREPLLYLSLFLKEHRGTYYDLLDRVRYEGDWERWLTFFLEGVKATAENAVATARRLVDMFAADQARIQQQGRRAGSALRAHGALKERPIASIGEIQRRSGLSYPTAASAMQLLVRLGIAREVTGRRRARFYAYEEYITILNEGTEGSPGR
jgi:Fic family protein